MRHAALKRIALSQEGVINLAAKQTVQQSV